MSVRLAKACRDLNIGISTATDYLKLKGFEFPNDPNFNLTDDIFALLKEKFYKDLALKIVVDKISTERRLMAIQDYSVSVDNILPSVNSYDLNTPKSKVEFPEVITPDIDLSIPNYIVSDNDIVHPESNISIEENKEFELIRKMKVETLDNMTIYFDKNEKQIKEKIKSHNSIETLLFEGVYQKVGDTNFGFFENVSLPDGREATYPITNKKVDKVFIATNSLNNGKRYLFEATLAIKFERIKYSNPFLLQANIKTIEDIKQISEINDLLISRQSRLDEINVFLETAESQYEQKKTEIEERLSKTLDKEEEKAKIIIDSYDKIIIKKLDEIDIKAQEIASLDIKVQESNNNLEHMENLISSLKDRVSLCRNLQFISEDDENNYINLLSTKEYQPENHLDFNVDFERSFSNLAEHIHSYLFHKKNLIYTQYQIRNFLTLLRTHDLIVLSGLSGSGKTQIVKAFAEALGGIAKIIPVKPNWTSSDDLIGYYNPLQMTFLPTPFTEAIVEAINNPNQLYFICLDEMNLARVEYYFADFLSKLEERNKQPEIELYAKHEEEQFVSEFNTMLNLIESSIEGKQINSWQEFLDNDNARKKFFEMLGNSDKESMLQLHSKMKRRLIDILKFPSTIKIPDNVRFIGAINVDETTHYFSPKILDRIHVVKFENPLLYEEDVNKWFENHMPGKELKPVYAKPSLFSERKEYPSLKNKDLDFVLSHLKKINSDFLIQLKIDFGIRSIRQSLNFYSILFEDGKYRELFDRDDEEIEVYDVNEIYFSEKLQIINTIIIQKILPRFIFDGNEITNSGKTKKEVAVEFNKYLEDELKGYMEYDSEGIPDHEEEVNESAFTILNKMIVNSEFNSGNFNFFA